MLHALTAKLTAWGSGFIALLPNLAVALLVLAAFWWLSHLAAKLLNRALDRAGMNKAARGLTCAAARIAVVFGGVMVALGVLNLDKALASILAGAGVLGLALGFAFQDLAANVISGIGLAAGNSHPFKIGDVIETNGILGRVETINIRTTEIATMDGSHVVIPNKLIFQDKLTNFNSTAQRRVELTCGISYGEDLEHVKRVVFESVSKVSSRLLEREVEVFFTGFGDSSINFVARVWVEYHEPADALAARSEAIMGLKQAFDREGILIPFPIRTLDFGIKGGQNLNRSLAELPQFKRDDRTLETAPK